ncbi:MAG: hypothetical protein ACM3JB_14470, partial [Acidobacteriaceae bacterium]
RELHIEQGMKAMRERTHAGKVLREARDGHDVLIETGRFAVERYQLKEAKTFAQKQALGSAQILVAADGAGVVEAPGAQPVAFNRGEAVIIPASVQEFTVRPQWTLEMLRMRVPAEKLPPPKTTVP